MYNLIEYRNNYSKKSGSLCQYYRNELALDKNGAITDFATDNYNNASFKFKTKIADRIENNDTKEVKIMVPLK